jgi:hypothetical protein
MQKPPTNRAAGAISAILAAGVLAGIVMLVPPWWRAYRVAKYHGKGADLRCAVLAMAKLLSPLARRISLAKVWHGLLDVGTRRRHHGCERMSPGPRSPEERSRSMAIRERTETDERDQLVAALLRDHPPICRLEELMGPEPTLDEAEEVDAFLQARTGWQQPYPSSDKTS